MALRAGQLLSGEFTIISGVDPPTLRRDSRAMSFLLMIFLTLVCLFEFNPPEMIKLYQLGYERGRANAWETELPDVEEAA